MRPSADVPLPPIKDCVRGRVYRLRCRRLSIGVFDGEDGFIGIRSKFDYRYLFTEHHWEVGDFGTVAGAEDLGIDVPADIPLATQLGTVDRATGRQLDHDDDIENPNVEGLMGWWRFSDTREIAPTIAAGLDPIIVDNKALFEFLEQTQRQLDAASTGPTSILKRCPSCHEMVRVQDGRLAPHTRQRGKDKWVPCEGGGQPLDPTEAP